MLRYSRATVIAWTCSALCGLLPKAHGDVLLAIPDTYIVTRKANTMATSFMSASYSVSKRFERFDLVRYHGDTGFRASSSTSIRQVLDPIKVLSDCAEILRDPTVRTCEPDVWERLSLVPNDPHFHLQWYLESSYQSGDIGAGAAWQRGTGSKDVLIGVLDSGVATDHPDLLPNLWTNPSDPADGRDNDANGVIDDIHGSNIPLNSGALEDVVGHGTHVSGIIGARGDNQVGTSGVMWSASLVVAGVSENKDNLVRRSNVIKGFEYLYDLKVRGHNIRAVNASLSGEVYSSAMYSVLSRLRDADVLVVTAAGNSSVNVDNTPHYPCNYDLENIVCVAATDRNGNLASYSNFGSSVDIAAPGGSSDVGGTAGLILSTYSPLAPLAASYAYMQGTSMATPVVTGALGLLASQRPHLSGPELKSLLLSSADRSISLAQWVQSGRLLNVDALTAVSEQPDLCPNDPAKTQPGVCGCGVRDSFKDTDSDQTYDCKDGCPNDPDKIQPGACGCGLTDSFMDTDSDQTYDCKDGCPNDPAKIQPGVCGCGLVDSLVDSDSDHTYDCMDGCPNDATKTLGGVCGCGVLDVDANRNGQPDCKDPVVAGLSPIRPIVKTSKGKVIVKMPRRPGLGFLLKVQSRVGKKKPRTVYYSTSLTPYTIKGLTSKAHVTVSYAYVLYGKPIHASRFSSSIRITMK